MPSNYTNTPILDVFETIGSGRGDRFFDQFQHTDRGNYEALKLLSANTPQCVPKPVLEQKIRRENIHEGQSIYIDVNQKTTPGTGTQSRRIGSGGNNRQQVQLSLGTGIEEGFDISSTNEKLSRFDSLSINERIEFSRAYLVLETYKNILDRLEAAAQTFLDTNKWASGGVGTAFNASGNYKVIPAADDNAVFWKVQQEAIENKFKSTGFDVLGSPHVARMIGETEGYGQQNERNLLDSLSGMTPYISDRLTPPDAANQQAVLYAIARGGVGMYSKAYMPSDGPLEIANDGWEQAIGLPPVPMFEGIDGDLFDISVKYYKGHQDTFSTYNVDSARNDVQYAWSFVLKPIFFTSYSPTTRKPIVAYVKLS